MLILIFLKYSLKYFSRNLIKCIVNLCAEYNLLNCACKNRVSVMFTNEDGKEITSFFTFRLKVMEEALHRVKVI